MYEQHGDVKGDYRQGTRREDKGKNKKRDAAVMKREEKRPTVPTSKGVGGAKAKVNQTKRDRGG